MYKLIVTTLIITSCLSFGCGSGQDNYGSSHNDKQNDYNSYDGGIPSSNWKGAFDREESSFTGSTAPELKFTVISESHDDQSCSNRWVEITYTLINNTTIAQTVADFEINVSYEVDLPEGADRALSALLNLYCLGTNLDTLRLWRVAA